MKYAAIHLPDFSLQALLEGQSRRAAGAVVVLDETAAKNRRRTVLSLTPAARGSGVEPGMSAPQVLARCPRAKILERSVSLEESVSEVLLAAARLFAPRVEASGPGLCTVDLQGVLPEHRERRPGEILAYLRNAGLEGRIGIARTPELARLASRRADPVLAVTSEEALLRDLPLSAAGPSFQLKRVLEQWGVRTLGAFAKLPRQAVAERLGGEGLALWDRIHGRDSDILRPAALPRTFEEHIEFEKGLETLEPLLFYVRRFTDRLLLRMEAAQRAVEEVVLELRQEQGPAVCRNFRLPEPTTRAEIVFRMLRTCLESLKTGQPLTGLSLRVMPCRIQARQRELFGSTVKDPHRFSETLARLAAVVGSENVGSPRPRPTHRPDAFRLAPFDRDEKSGAPGDPEQAEDGIGPVLRRFRPPIPARVESREGRPAEARSRAFDDTLRRVRGPWRMSGEWWRPDAWSREEWDVETSAGGLYRLTRQKDGWWVDGMYD